MCCHQATVSKSTQSLISYSSSACSSKMSENSIYSGIALFVQLASHTIWAIPWQAPGEWGRQTGGNTLQSWMLMFRLVSERSNLLRSGPVQSFALQYFQLKLRPVEFFLFLKETDMNQSWSVFCKFQPVWTSHGPDQLQAQLKLVFYILSSLPY